MRPASIALIGLILSGCADPSSSPFDPQAAAFVHAHGKGAIEGKAFTTNDQGHVIYAAGQRVYLIPATPYARERYEAMFFGRRDLPPWVPELHDVDPRFREFIRTTVANEGGSFVFDGLVPGTYLVATQVSWKPESRLIPEGKKMYETVIVTGQETEAVKVVLSGA